MRAGSVGPRTPIPPDLSEAAADKLLRDNMAMKPLRAGAADHHWIDAYTVTCGSADTTLFMDMYHCSSEPPDFAPTGFDIIR